MRHHNRFLLLILLIALLFALLFVFMNSVSQKQDLRSQAAKSEVCQQNIDCPTGTACINGTCVLKAVSPSQSPLSYAKISEIDQEAKPIPSYFVEPTSTSQPPLLLRMAYGINSFIGNTFGAVFTFIDSQLQNIIVSF